MAGKKWLVEPRDTPTVICSGRFLASSISSFMLFQGVLPYAANTDGVEVTRATGSNSL